MRKFNAGAPLAAGVWFGGWVSGCLKTGVWQDDARIFGTAGGFAGFSFAGFAFSGSLKTPVCLPDANPKAQAEYLYPTKPLTHPLPQSVSAVPEISDSEIRPAANFQAA